MKATSVLAPAACAMLIGLSGLFGSTAKAAGSLETGFDLTLNQGGQPVSPEIWTVLAGPGGTVQGVLNYTRTYEVQGHKVVYTGHRLDMYAGDGSFTRTLATDTSSGYPSFVTVNGSDVYLGHSDPAGDSIDRVVDGLSASGGTTVPVVSLKDNWAMSFAPDGTAYAMYYDGMSKIARLDLTTGAATTVVAVGGNNAGLDFAPNGDLYFSTYGADASRPDQVLRLTAAQLAGSLPLDISAAQAVAQLPAGTGGGSLAVDNAGNVVFAINDTVTYSSGVLACIYAGKDYSGKPGGYDWMANGTTWLGNVETVGDVSLFDWANPANAAFTNGYFTPITAVPEPATMCLLAVAALAGVLRRRRRS